MKTLSIEEQLKISLGATLRTLDLTISNEFKRDLLMRRKDELNDLLTEFIKQLEEE